MKLWCSMICAADRCGLWETVCPSAAAQVSKPLAVQNRTVVSTQKSVAHPVMITRLDFFSRSSASRRVPRKLSLAVLLIVSSHARRSSAAKICQPSVPGSSTSPGGPSCCTQTTKPPPSRTHPFQHPPDDAPRSITGRTPAGNYPSPRRSRTGTMLHIPNAINTATILSTRVHRRQSAFRSLITSSDHTRRKDRLESSAYI
jgi:hypothetical protein